MLDGVTSFGRKERQPYSNAAIGTPVCFSTLLSLYMALVNQFLFMSSICHIMPYNVLLDTQREVLDAESTLNI